MKNAILYAFFGYAIVLVWLKTDAFYEYFKIFKFKILKDYEKSKQLMTSNNFARFLFINYNNFFTRLISCVYCLSFWISLVIGCLTNFKYFGLIYFIILISFYITERLSNNERKE